MIKKIFIYLFVLILLLLLFSCDKTPQGSQESGANLGNTEEKQISEDTNGTVDDTDKTQTVEDETSQFTPEEEILGRLGFQLPTEDIEAPDFSLLQISPPNQENKETKLSDFQGKMVFLNFWATWCPPCRKEMPSMEELWKDFKEKDFVILAVNLNEERAKVSSFLEEFGYTFPVLLDSTGEVGGTYGAQSIPTTYLIDKKGYVLGRFVGTREWNTEDVRSAFTTLLEKPE